MKKTSKPAAVVAPARCQAVIYVRVSSMEQEKEGFSIPAQLKLLKEYAVANGFTVAQEYVDVETAKQTGRAAFGEMVAYLKSHPSIRVMLVEKTDRLYRNLKDWVTMDDLDVEMHFPKEGVVLSRESRSSEKGKAMATIPATMPAMPSNVRNPQRSFLLAARTAATIANMPSIIRKTANRPTSDNSVGPGKRNAIKPMMSPKTPVPQQPSSCAQGLN
jgi:DNA invertase Pin-like site-specific DNA recombinase